jgi:hypothetical protein
MGPGVGLLAGVSAVAFVLADSGMREFASQMPAYWEWGYGGSGIPSNFIGWASGPFLTGNRLGGLTNYLDSQGEFPYGGLVERRTYVARNYYNMAGRTKGLVYTGGVEVRSASHPDYDPPSPAPAGVPILTPIPVPATGPGIGPDSRPGIGPGSAPQKLPMTSPMFPGAVEVDFSDSAYQVPSPGQFLGGRHPNRSSSVRLDFQPGIGTVPNAPPPPVPRPAVRNEPIRTGKPPEGTKERKMKSRSVAIVGAFISAPTDSVDLVQYFYRALPRELQTVRRRTDVLGRFNQVWKHLDKVDFETLVGNVIVSQVNDSIYSITGRYAAKASNIIGNITGRPVGIAVNNYGRGDLHDFPSPESIAVEWINIDPAVRAVLRGDPDAFRAWVLSHY